MTWNFSQWSAGDWFMAACAACVFIVMPLMRLYLFFCERADKRWFRQIFGREYGRPAEPADKP